jgi:ABC-type phosphate transport system substrate-binding protein
MFTDHLNDVCPAAGVPYGQGVSETFNPPNPQPPGSSFIGANGGNAMISDILHPANSTHGAVGYITPSFVQPLNQAGPMAALAINAAGNAIAPTPEGAFEAVFHGPFAQPPPGYPQTSPKTYITDPKASDAYPITGMVIMYFYRCYPNTDIDIPAMTAFFTAALLPTFGGPLTPYDIFANQNGLGQLPNRFKSDDLRAINSIKVNPPSTTCKGS